MKYLFDKILKDRCGLDYLKFYKNNSYEFIPSDSDKLWLQNLKYNSHNFSIKYYQNNPIEYKLNNEGFRTPDDFNSEDEGNVYLGCSHTIGIGHHLENMWSYKLNQIIGGKFWNLAIGGTGVATHFRILLAYYKELKIKNIFHFAPMYPRYEFIENGIPETYIISNYSNEYKKNFGNLLQNSLITNEQCEMNWITYTCAIRGLAKEIGANYYLIEGDTGIHANDDNSLQARDLSHHTTKIQHEIYQSFLKLLGNDYYDKFKNTQEPIYNIEEYIKNSKTKKSNLI